MALVPPQLILQRYLLAFHPHFSLLAQFPHQVQLLLVSAATQSASMTITVTRKALQTVVMGQQAAMAVRQSVLDLFQLLQRRKRRVVTSL